MQKRKRQALYSKIPIGTDFHDYRCNSKYHFQNLSSQAHLSYYNQKEDYQIFFDYKGFGISQKDNIKYAYMWILNESYYVENGKLEIGSGSSMPYKFRFDENNIIMEYEKGKRRTSKRKKCEGKSTCSVCFPLILVIHYQVNERE